MSEKEKILSKFAIKDYRNELELVLENKQFDEEAKSLLLNIFYKIDNFYKDYLAVKKESENKNKFLEEYMNIIKNKCNKIIILSPQDTTKTRRYEVDKKLGEIKTFPNENILMQAIFELTEVDLNKPNIEFNNKCILDLLNKGKSINSIEPIRDFNGWSWNIAINDVKNIYYNLIFQNLLILFGYNYINENMNTKNIYEQLKMKSIIKSSKKIGIELLECLLQIAIILYNNDSKEKHNECVEYKKNIQKDSNSSINKYEYINDITKNNLNILKEIQKIDVLLNDINSLRNSFQEKIEKGEKQYFSLGEYIESIENEKEILKQQIEHNNKLINPKEYLKNQEGDNRLKKLYSNIREDSYEINIDSKLVKFQKLFLQFLKFKFLQDASKKDLYLYATQLRYYANLPYKNTNVLMLSDIDEIFEDVSKVLINKIIENKVIDLGFKNKKLNYEIIKYIFKCKIMKLDNIVLKINFMEDNKIEVEYYDGNMIESKKIFDIPLDEEILSRKTRKIKLFKVSM